MKNAAAASEKNGDRRRVKAGAGAEEQRKAPGKERKPEPVVKLKGENARKKTGGRTNEKRGCDAAKKKKISQRLAAENEERLVTYDGS